MTSDSFQYKAMHFNTHGIASKCNEFKALIADLPENNLHIDFNLLCETFITQANVHLSGIPGFQVLHKCRKKHLGVVWLFTYLKTYSFTK